MVWIATVVPVLLVPLLVLTPVVWSSTAETWTDGIYDYESDEMVQVIAQKDVAAVQADPLVSFEGVLVVVRSLLVSEPIRALHVVPSPSDPRGPPQP